MKYKIEDLLEKVIDNRGKTPPTSTTGHMLLEISSLTGDNKYPNYGAVQKNVSKETYNTWFRSGHPQVGDILIPTVGTLDALAYLNRDDCCIAQNVIAFRTKKEICDGNYLYYLLRDKRTRARLLNLNIGGVQPSIKVPHLKQLEVEIPDLETQKKIVRILSALDQKIELNNQHNKNLMRTAHSFYRDLLNKKSGSWEHGYIGDGIMTKIEKSGVSKYLGTKKYVATADVIGTNINHFEEVKYDEKPSRANMLPRENTIWFAKMEGSEKNILVTDYSTDLIKDYIFSTGFMGVQCLNNFIYFMWCYINDKTFFNIKNALSTGTLMAGISNSTIKNAKYSIPPQNLMVEFNAKVKPLFEKIHNNNLQNETLSKLRNTLLPRLMSGEIKLNKVTLNE